MRIPSRIRAHPEIEDEIEHIYEVTFVDNGRQTLVLTTLTMDPDAVTQWIDDVNVNVNVNTRLRHIGFEYEFDNHNKCIGTLQLCVGRCCLIFQLPRAPLPPSLDEFLGDPNNAFVGIHILSKMEMLRRQCPFDASPVQCIDLHHLSPLPRLPSSIVETDWACPMKLSDHQVHYASLDVFFNLQIARCFWKI